MMELPHFEVCYVQEEICSTFDFIAAGKPMVIDFWTTKCTRCPDALTKLDDLAQSNPEVKFISCVLDDKETAAELLEGMWENLIHTYMDESNKEKAKEVFGFSQVPYCIIVNKDGMVVAANSPNNINFSEILPSILSIVANNNAPKFVTDEDF